LLSQLNPYKESLFYQYTNYDCFIFSSGKKDLLVVVLDELHIFDGNKEKCDDGNLRPSAKI
jgi:hypothetical protein